MTKKRLDKEILIYTIIISSLLFFGGVFIGYNINMDRLSDIQKEINNVNSDVDNFQLQFLFFDVLGENATCPLLKDTLANINKKSYEIGSKITLAGQEGKIQDYSEQDNLIEEYSRVSVSYWLLANKMKASCESNATTILFFISKECDNKIPNPCDDQGYVLTYYKEKFGNDLLVFTLSEDVEEASVHVLKDFYNITEYPTMIVEGDKYENFVSKAELGIILCEHGMCV